MHLRKRLPHRIADKAEPRQIGTVVVCGLGLGRRPYELIKEILCPS